MTVGLWGEPFVTSHTGIFSLEQVRSWGLCSKQAWAAFQTYFIQYPHPTICRTRVTQPPTTTTTTTNNKQQLRFVFWSVCMRTQKHTKPKQPRRSKTTKGGSLVLCTKRPWIETQSQSNSIQSKIQFNSIHLSDFLPNPKIHPFFFWQSWDTHLLVLVGRWE